MKKQIKSALKFHKYICKEDPANIQRYNNAFIAGVKRLVK